MRTTLRSLNPSSRLTFTGGSHFCAYSNDVPRHLVVMTVFRARAFTSATKYVLAVNTSDVRVTSSAPQANQLTLPACDHARAFCVSISAEMTYAGYCQLAREMISCGPSLRVPSPSRPRGKLSDQQLRFNLRRFPSCFQDPHGSRRLFPRSVPYMT